MKGRIFHKILYRLSKEQRKLFLGEEVKLNTAQDLQSQVNKEIENLFVSCAKCNNIHDYTFIDATIIYNKLNACSVCWQETEFLKIEHFRPKIFQDIAEVYHEPKRFELVDRMVDILSEIRELPDRKAVTSDGYFTEEVMELYFELKGILDQIVEKRISHYNKLREVSIYRPAQDLRQRHRSRSAFLFKNLPDFSGCEEEADFDAHRVKTISSFFIIKKVCTTIQNPLLPRLIPLSNLRMTG